MLASNRAMEASAARVEVSTDQQCTVFIAQFSWMNALSKTSDTSQGCDPPPVTTMAFLLAALVPMLQENFSRT
jgi:hypothetical protein